MATYLFNCLPEGHWLLDFKLKVWTGEAVIQSFRAREEIRVLTLSGK